MNPIAEMLLDQVTYAQEVGHQILALSGLNEDGVIVFLATELRYVYETMCYSQLLV